MRIVLAVPLALLLLSCAAAPPAPKLPDPIVVELWPGKVPGDAGIPGAESTKTYESPLVGPTMLVSNVSRPSIAVYPAPKDRNTGTAMVICPGGGYWNLFWELEGTEVAAWLNSVGMTAIILKYRVPRRPNDVKGEPAPGPLLDAQRAVSVVRARAAEWGVDPGRIGMVGFSAGGHLVFATATNFDQRKYEPVDAADQASCRPDFGVMCYPGYMKAADKDELSPGLRVPPGTPPILLAHAYDDSTKVGGSIPDHSAVTFLALKRAGIPAELHIFADGNHDFGVRRNGKLTSSWPDLCLKWLRSLNLLRP
jgi:acetyl esterase/lipase